MDETNVPLVPAWRKLRNGEVEVDLDSPPYIPIFGGDVLVPSVRRGKVMVRREGDDVFVGSERLTPHRVPGESRYVHACELYQDVVLRNGLRTAHPNVLDALHVHTELIPSWMNVAPNGDTLCFTTFDVIFRDGAGISCYRNFAFGRPYLRGCGGYSCSTTSVITGQYVAATLRE